RDAAGLRSCSLCGSAMIDPAAPDGGVKWDERSALAPELFTGVVATGASGAHRRAVATARQRQAKAEDALVEVITAARVACDSRVTITDVMDCRADEVRTRYGGPVGEQPGQT
ncbi:MAG: hypothetical protein ACYCTH_14910, partial [Cellulomonas sp.]